MMSTEYDGVIMYLVSRVTFMVVTKISYFYDYTPNWLTIQLGTLRRVFWDTGPLRKNHRTEKDSRRVNKIHSQYI